MSRGHALFISAVLVAVVKLGFFAADRHPILFLGDSGTYIQSAVSGLPPLDRSFTYPILIRIFGIWPASLTTLVAAQAIAGWGVALVLAHMLLSVFRVRPGVAIAMSAAVAVEPMQITFERLVLTEAFSQLALAAYLATACFYILRPRLITLSVVHAIGVGLLSLRFVYVPVTFVCAVALPLLAAWRANVLVEGSIGDEQPIRTKAGSTLWFAHLIVSLVLVAGLHDGYKRLNGHLSDRLPAYQYTDGLFLAAAMAPFISPDDAQEPRVAEIVRGTPHLDDWSFRDAQRWAPKGLASRIQAAVPSLEQANRLARRLALNAIYRDPLILPRLGLGNLRSYGNLTTMPRELARELGVGRPLPDTLVDRVQRHFHVDVRDMPTHLTLSKRYYLSGSLWYAMLLTTPVIMLLGCVACPRVDRPPALLLLVMTACIMTVTIVLTVAPIVRYLYPLTFFFLAATGIIIDSWLDRARCLLSPARSATTG